MAELTNGSVSAEALTAAAAAGAASAAGVPVDVVETRSVADASAAVGHIVALAEGAAGRVAVAVPPETESAEAVATGAAGAALGALGGGESGTVRVVADLAEAGLDTAAAVAEIKALIAGTEAAIFLVVEGLTAPSAPSVSEAAFPDVGGGPAAVRGMRDVAVLSDVAMTVTVELGRTSLRVRDLLGLSSGSVVELDQRAGAPVDILVNGTAVARGDVVVVDEELGVRITEVLGGV